MLFCMVAVDGTWAQAHGSPECYWLVKVWKIFSAYLQLESRKAALRWEIKKASWWSGTTSQTNQPNVHTRKQANNLNKKQTTPGTTETRDIPQVLGYPHLSMALEIGGIYTRAELESRCSGTSERKRQLVPWTEKTFSLLSRLETVNANIRVSYRGCICVLLWMGPCLTIFDILYTIAYLDNDLINWALLCKNTLSRGANRSQLTAKWGSKFGSCMDSDIWLLNETFQTISGLICHATGKFENRTFIFW